MKTVIILMTDINYIDKTIHTIEEIRYIGKYNGDIVVMPEKHSVNSRLQDAADSLRFTIKVFEPIDLTYIMFKLHDKPFKDSIDGRELTKTFQWHKLHVFDTYFKQWDMIFYIDAGMHIYRDISVFTEIFLNEKEKANGAPVFLAHSDTYPTYIWKLRNQFERYAYPDEFRALETHINLDVDYFQSGILLFDSSVIENQTKNDLCVLANTYYISRTNEQGIMNIYFNGIHKIWNPLPVYYNHAFTYDYWNREGYSPEDYCMLKYIR
jgi:hypothetical protein